MNWCYYDHSKVPKSKYCPRDMEREKHILYHYIFDSNLTLKPRALSLSHILTSKKGRFNSWSQKWRHDLEKYITVLQLQPKRARDEVNLRRKAFKENQQCLRNQIWKPRSNGNILQQSATIIKVIHNHRKYSVKIHEGVDLALSR